MDVVIGQQADLGAPPIWAEVSYDVVGEASSWVKSRSMRARQLAVGVAILANEETSDGEAYLRGQRGQGFGRAG